MSVPLCLLLHTSHVYATSLKLLFSVQQSIGIQFLTMYYTVTSITMSEN